jgi:hypothetical protein
MKDQLDYSNLQKFILTREQKYSVKFFQTLFCDVYVTKCPTAALKTRRFTVQLLQSFTKIRRNRTRKLKERIWW